MLVIALDDVIIDDALGQFLAASAALNQEFQFRLLEKTLHRARRVTGIVPHPVLVTVGIENYRTLTILRLQAISVQLGLLLAHRGVLASTFGLYQR